jgi:hypothetical protein
VGEVLDDGLGHPLADVGRGDEQVIVLQHHRRQIALGGLELGHHRVGEALVHGHVARVPGQAHVAVDRRLGGEAPQVVVDEPQGRVREDVVVAVVLLAVVHDHADGEIPVAVGAARGHLGVLV